MTGTLPADIDELERQFNAAERDACALATGLDERVGVWRVEADSWSVAECLDHLAATNREYLRSMRAPAARARAQRRQRRGPATPGFLGRWFVRTLEPPVTARLRAPRIIRPYRTIGLLEALYAFRASQDDVRTFLHAYANIELTRVRFPNPFLRGLQFSLATGLHAIAAHERRHLWQAWLVRKLAVDAADAGRLT